MPIMACDTKRKQLNKKLFSEFSPTEPTFLRNFDFFESDITDSELQHLLRVLIENNDVFSEFTYDVGKITRVKLKEDAELRKQRPSKVPLHYRDRREILVNDCKEQEVFVKTEVMLKWVRYSLIPSSFYPKEIPSNW